MRAFWNRSRVCVLLALIGGTGASRSMGQEPPDPIRVARLVERLGAESFSERTNADQELAALGAAAREHLEEAASSSDPEVRMRARGLLRRLNLEELWRASPFTHAGAAPASEVVAALAEQTGARLLMGDSYGAFHDGQVVLEEQHNAFWPALDAICRQTGNHARPHYDHRDPGLVIVAGPAGNRPIGYAGPVRASVSGGRRTFIEEVDFSKPDAEITHTFQLNLEMTWEDRLQVVAHRPTPEVIQAVTDTGVALSTVKSNSGDWSLASGSRRLATMHLRLSPPPTSARTLKLLALRWGVIAVGDFTSLELDDLASRAKHYQDDVHLQLLDMERGPGSRVEITLVVSRDLAIPEPREVVFQENRFELFDADDKPYRKQGQTNSITEQGARMKLSFLGASNQSEPAKLRFTYPRLRSQRDLEIELRDVPLPVATPD